MENESRKWRFKGKSELKKKGAAADAVDISIRGIIESIKQNLNKEDERVVIPLAHGDPSYFSCFRTDKAAEDAVVDSLRSSNFNSYSPAHGILQTRRAVADLLSVDLPYNLSVDDVYLTCGCKQAIETIITALSFPGSNILLPKPGFPLYEARAAFSHLEARHFDLLPEKDWEVDLDAVEALADDNTVALVIINPGNPCGNVYTRQHLQKIAETARKLGILVIADEVYAHLTFGNAPFVPMGAFASIAPVITLGSISKRWVVPGWRFGWLVPNDPDGILLHSGIVERIKSYGNLTVDPVTFIQAAVPQIIERTEKGFFLKINNMLREAAFTCFDRVKEIPGISCSTKPEGSMFMMVKLDLSLLKGIKDDYEFCLKLAKEESVIILPGSAVGLKNWLRMSFGIDIATLEEGLQRLKAFCQRHV